MFMYLVTAMSSWACSRNFVTVTSLDFAKYFVIAISSSTTSSCYAMGAADSRNLVTVTSLAAWSRNLVTVVSKNFVTVISLAAASYVITFYIFVQ